MSEENWTKYYGSGIGLAAILIALAETYLKEKDVKGNVKVKDGYVGLMGFAVSILFVVFLIIIIRNVEFREAFNTYISS